MNMPPHEQIVKLFASKQHAIQVVKTLDALCEYGAATKIKGTFIKAMLKSKPVGGSHRLFGLFKQGTAVSGRLTSSNMNMQNIPSQGFMGKLIKRCFRAPKGRMFGGADSDSLEDKISALTTKDPNKIKVYTQGYDGHALRAYSYEDSLPIIDEKLVPYKTESKGFYLQEGEPMHTYEEIPEGSKELTHSQYHVHVINYIAEVYPDQRQESKIPTFTLTYDGTHISLMNELGYSFEKATRIEDRYHALYTHADLYISTRIQGGIKDGYVTVAFGLRVRCPILHQSYTTTTGYFNKYASSESKTIGNAMGQSYCMLTARAANDMRQRIRNSKYKYTIWCISNIHDALYFEYPLCPDALSWLNANLLEAMSWQELPEIQHSVVKLSAQMEVYSPSWADVTKVPKELTTEQAYELGYAISLKHTT